MSDWQLRSVQFKFQLSDWTLFSVSIPLQVRVAALNEDPSPAEAPLFPEDDALAQCEGFLIRSLPVARELPAITRWKNYLRYTPLQYQHCHIDLSQSFDQYQKKFSSKTRSTINRKVKKYATHSGGTIPWKTYKSPEEMREFFRLARGVSSLTYQERLLNAGLPDTEEFTDQAEALAAEQRIRAYILFDGDKPVAYLYCPVHDGVLIYSYLGYDPAYLHMSVGTVLQWLAIEQLFGERKFRYFDFTEGQSDHKRLFATHQRLCANVFQLRATIQNTMLIRAHLSMNQFSKWLGNQLDHWGLKARIKRILRFGA